MSSSQSGDPLSFLFPALRRFVDAELAAGNRIERLDIASLFILLAKPFFTAIEDAEVDYSEIKGRGFSFAHYVHCASAQIVACMVIGN
jgi:hypothetical protein